LDYISARLAIAMRCDLLPRDLGAIAKVDGHLTQVHIAGEKLNGSARPDTSDGIVVDPDIRRRAVLVVGEDKHLDEIDVGAAAVVGYSQALAVGPRMEVW